MSSKKLTVCQMTAVKLMPRASSMAPPSCCFALGAGRGGLANVCEEQERDDQTVNRDRLGERHTDDHRQEHRPARLGVPTHGLHGASANQADADAGSDGCQPNREADRERNKDAFGHSLLLIP